MGRVSLTEAYDDRSVIAKLNEMDKRVKENTTVVTSAEASAKASAQAAQETADRFAGSVGAVVQNANAQINASKAEVDQAKADVDATVTTVAQAVQTANNASASAQESAQTVAGYENRVTALETADGENVKIDSINAYAVGLTGNQLNISGNKGFLNSVELLRRNTFTALGWTNIFNVTTTNVYAFMMVAGQSIILCHLTNRSLAQIIVFGINGRPYTDCVKIAHNKQTDEYEVWFNAEYGSWARGYMISEGSGNSAGTPTNYVVRNVRGNEPVVGDVYDRVDTCVRLSVIT